MDIFSISPKMIYVEMFDSCTDFFYINNGLKYALFPLTGIL